MWFKNLNVYRIGAHSDFTGIANFPFNPCSSNEMKSIGWSDPRPDQNGNFLHVINKQILLCFTVEKKILPAASIKQVVIDRAAEIELQQGFKPGRKMFKEIKEQVIEDMMPRAFSSRRNVGVWIDRANGWLVIDTPSHSMCDDVLKLLLKSIESLPIEMLRVKLSPLAAMTDWLAGDEAPEHFTIDQDAELQSRGESRAKVKYTRHNLDPAEIANHISAGKQCISLAMTWNDKISFVLKDSLTIKRIKPLDVLTENTGGKNEAERLDGDFILMTSELNSMLTDLVGSLGGEAKND